MVKAVLAIVATQIGVPVGCLRPTDQLEDELSMKMPGEDDLQLEEFLPELERLVVEHGGVYVFDLSWKTLDDVIRHTVRQIPLEK
jgi:hypothetical protein